MNSVPTWFFATAAFFALCGMIWGIQMAATQDYLLSPAHGHLNLIGFVTMAVIGTYYALTPSASGTRLAAIHYGLTTVTVVTLTPGIVFAINGEGEALGQIGSILAVASMALFLFMVVRHGIGTEPESRTHEQSSQAQPAE